MILFIAYMNRITRSCFSGGPVPGRRAVQSGVVAELGGHDGDGHPGMRGVVPGQFLGPVCDGAVGPTTATRMWVPPRSTASTAAIATP